MSGFEQQPRDAEVSAEKSLRERCTHLWIHGFVADKAYRGILRWEEVTGDIEHCEPGMRLQDKQAQYLMDSLWQCGIRPTEGSGSAGSLAATERHLKDMQRLVFAPPLHFFRNQGNAPDATA